MKKIKITRPELVLVAATRLILGAGIGLLTSDRLEKDGRRALGWTLIAIGGLSTFPLVKGIVGSNRRSSPRLFFGAFSKAA